MSAINQRNIEAVYGLSPMQEGMLFHSLQDPDSGMYFAQTIANLHGELKTAAFENAWRRVVERHSILRTSFVWKRLDKMLQAVHRKVSLSLEQQDWRGISQEEQKNRLDIFLRQDQRRGFNLGKAPLMRLTLIRTFERQYQLIWSHHHLLLDGWSLPILMKEVFTLYEAFSQGKEIGLPPARPYREYIAWLQKQDMVAAQNFWMSHLRGFAAPTGLGVDRSRSDPDQAEAGYGKGETRLSAEATAGLKKTARQHQLTLNVLFQGAWAILLGRYSSEEDVVFGSTVSGRPADLPGSEAMIGLFINTLPMRVKIRPEESFLSWLEGLQVHQAEMRQYEYSPLVMIHGWSEIPRGMPLFESIFIFENYPVEKSLFIVDSTKTLRFDDIQHASKINYPLAVVTAPADEMILECHYDQGRFDGGSVARMLGHLKALLEAIAADPRQRIGQLGLLSRAERVRALHAWNATAAEYPRERCLHELFEEQVRRDPEAIAVRFEGRGLSYGELDRRANRLARHLRGLGVGPEVLVGICLERSVELVEAVLGVLKAGGAYVPLDPELPAERLGYMVSDTGLSVVVSRRAEAEALPEGGYRVVRLDGDGERIARESAEGFESGAVPENLAYVIYTSGSTGRPKGTLLPHRGVANFITAFSQDLSITSKSRMLQFSAFAFDASVAEIFSALCSGGCLCLARRETLLAVQSLAHLLAVEGLTHATLPPSLLEILPEEGLHALRTVASVGDACRPSVASRWSATRRFFNGYGPTEASVGACWIRIDAEAAKLERLPIGRPIANLQVYVCDVGMNLQPVGVSGEILIGGVGVARGYLGRADLTAQRFIPDPFGEARGGRLYRTGDLGRYLPDGRLEFLGRIDHQVKLRGFRIELGEIEEVLKGHAAVGQAAVVLRGAEGRGEYLAAYVSLRGEAQAVSAEALQAHVRERLPEYMVPSAYVVMEQLPQTVSGKVDRRALPEPGEASRVRVKGASGARSGIEGELSQLWAQVLGLQRVGAGENFFDLGGHSLLATQLVSRVQRVFGVEVKLRDLFERPTVAAMAQAVSAGLAAGAGLNAPALLPRGAGEEPVLSFAQERLWFLDQLSPGSLAYSVPLAVRLEGELDAGALVAAVNAVVARHEVLRTRFETQKGRAAAVVDSELRLAPELEDLSGDSEPEREAQRRMEQELERPFDLSRGPLLRMRLFKLAPREHRLLLVLHHIVCDGWSLSVLTRELGELYAAHSQGRASGLAAPGVQYADFARWQRGWLSGEELERQLSYWKGRLGTSAPMLELPVDRRRTALGASRGAVHNFELSAALSAGVKKLCREQDVTVFMVLLAAFQVLLYRYTGQEDIRVGTPIANRTREEIEGLIGFFVNTLVMRGDLSGEPSFAQLLKGTREAALGAYAHQDLPFEVLVEALRPERDLSHTPLFQAMFVMNAAQAAEVELSGLRLSPVEMHRGAAVFDLTLALTESSGGLAGYVEYNADLFEAQSIARLLGHYERILEAVCADAEQPVSRLGYLSAEELERQHGEWNRTQAATPVERCVHELFEAQAAAQGEATAVVFEDFSLSYAQLNERANRLAHYLMKLGVGPEVLVGLSTLRLPEMVVGVLGVLKAGGAYVPLDPGYPAERLAFMLKDSGARVLLTQEAVWPQLGGFCGHLKQVICLDADWGKVALEPSENPVLRAGPQNLAYVIYTSGSTGRPKGTLLSHAGLSNLTGWQREVFGIGPGVRVLQFSPLSFDASVWETFMALANGGTLVLGRQEVLASGDELSRLIREQGVNHVTLPPSVLRVLPAGELPVLSKIVVAGERCTGELVERWGAGRGFFNAYGPTETTVCAAMKRCVPGEAGDPPIGRGIHNGRLYVLDARGEPVPVGVAGELCVGGVSLARGYLGRPGLTARKFVPDGFGLEPGGRLYRTGDLVRWRSDGQIEFLDRIDDQVKVRGYRIELGEVEAALRAVAGVRDAVAVADGARLLAYVVGEGAPEASELRGRLRERLPEYMVPSVVMRLEGLPMSPSGKVDRKRLPAPEAQARGHYVAPRTALEEKLAGMYAELLGLERVGVEENFFELGGHSLLATQLVSRIREAQGVELPLRTLFEYPTVAELAKSIEQSKAQPAVQAPAAITRLSRSAHRTSRSALP